MVPGKTLVSWRKAGRGDWLASSADQITKGDNSTTINEFLLFN